MSYKTRRHKDDGFGQLLPLCREFTFSRVNSQSRAFAAIPGGTTIGPDIEVQIVKILDQYGLEIAIPSPSERERTSYVLISRGKSRFVDAIPIPQAELRPSAELLPDFQKSEGGESCLLQSKTGIQGTGAAHAGSQARTHSAFFPAAKNHSYDQEELESYTCQFFVWRSSVNGGLQNGYKNGVSLRSTWTTIWAQHFIGTP